MNTLTLGVRNAFRNMVRTASITLILGLSIGLCLVMLIAHQAVGQKISDVKRSIGNTITITPAGFSNFSQANNALTTSQLNTVQTIAHVTNLTESLTGRLSTIGATSNSPFGQSSQDSTATTSLTSPVTLGSGGSKSYFGGRTLPTNFSLPISIVGTTDITYVDGNVITISSGTTIDGTKDNNVALISTAMATKNNLKIGSTFTAYNTKITVSGLFASSTKAGGEVVIVPLATLQRLSSQSGDVTSAIATVDSLDNLATVTSTVKSILGSNADIQNAQDEADSTIKPLENVASISLVSLFGAVIAGSVIILLTMIMIVRERRREIGILKAIGASNVRVIGQFMCEAITLTLAGAIIGIIIGVIGGNPVTNMLVTNSTNSNTSVSTTATTRTPGNGGFTGGDTGTAQRAFAGRPTNGSFLQRNGNSVANSVKNINTNIGWSILAYGLGAALLIAVIGSALAGWMIARVKPYEVMRAE